MKKDITPSSKSVARALGVSVATISRVLTRPDLVNEKTRERVLRGIERLGYRPNLAARDLRRGQTGTILVVVPQAGVFFLDVLRGVEQAADEHGFTVLLANTRGDLNRQRTHFDHVMSHRADGVILLTGQLPTVPTASQNRLPLVVAVEPVPSSNVSAVTVDHAEGAEQATQHLIALGHRRIAHIAGPDNVFSAGTRLAGYRKALRTARIAADECLVQRGLFSVESGAKAMQSLLRQRRVPTAVFCANDQMAIGAIGALRAVGLRVPADMSVVGFDDLELAEVYAPALTTIHIPRFDAGYQAMMILVDIISRTRPARSLTLSTRLVIRATTAPPPNR